MDSRRLLADLVALPGPPGQEDAVRDYVAARLDEIGALHAVDAKGNLLASPGSEIPEHPRVVVTAHLDEIALMLTGFQGVHRARVAPLGGVHPYKWGEGPVDILGPDGARHPAILSFGSVHTADPSASAQKHREGKAIGWEDAHLITGATAAALRERGVQEGARVTLGADRRRLVSLSDDAVAGPFLDDRADLVSWLLILEEWKRRGAGRDVLFAATVSEETGGEGALWVLGNCRPEYCVALEIGPIVPDAHVGGTEHPVVWARDSYASMSAADLARVSAAASDAGIALQTAVYSRGGSDASIGQAQGLCARGITLAFAVANSHGFEVMHVASMENLAKLTLAVLERV